MKVIKIDKKETKEYLWYYLKDESKDIEILVENEEGNLMEFGLDNLQPSIKIYLTENYDKR